MPEFWEQCDNNTDLSQEDVTKLTEFFALLLEIDRRNNLDKQAKNRPISILDKGGQMVYSQSERKQTK